MNRETIILLAMLAVVTVLVTAALLLIYDAMVFEPTANQTMNVTGEVSVA